MRSAALAGFLLITLAMRGAAQAAPTFGFDQVREQARALAQREHVPRPDDDLPAWLAQLDYDGYRRLRFRGDTTLWSAEGLPFRVQFMHRGYLFRRRVAIHVVDGASVRELRFAPAQFDYGDVAGGPAPEGLGYAGCALSFPLQGPDDWQEFAAFRGASYFRLLGKGQVYGASARGLAIDTAAAGGEEFPEFVALWLEQPRADATSLVVLALLDSPSVTGAYRFVLTPGDQTVAEVSVRLYARREVDKPGLAPLTSMFLHGEARLRHVADHRPEVHDSDGLLAADAAGGWLWRPLVNPERAHRISRLPFHAPRGFGLLQRDRVFASYEDLESHFQLRPSYWVTPRGDWGKGAVELVEIPTPAEWNDNVVAYWVPDRPLQPGREYAFDYALAAFLDDPARPPLARVRSTRVRTAEPASLFVLDFVGAQLAGDLAELRAHVEAPRGEVRNVVLQRNLPGGGVRCTFEFLGAGDEPIELRAALRRGDLTVTETWVLPWTRP